jgi:hypothetical protein
VIQFALGSFPLKSSTYFWLYLASLGVNWVIDIFVVREMFALALGEYPGIRTAGRWAMYGATAVSVTASLAITTFFWNGGARGRSNLFYVEVVNRSVVFTLAVVVASILIFLSRYPLHLHRNTYISTSFFGAVLLSEAALMLVDSLSPHLYSDLVDRTQVSFVAACLVGWAVMLRPQTAGAPARVSFETPAEQQLLRQLESFNSLLSRSGRQR